MTFEARKKKHIQIKNQVSKAFSKGSTMCYSQEHASRKRTSGKKKIEILASSFTIEMDERNNFCTIKAPEYDNNHVCQSYQTYQGEQLMELLPHRWLIFETQRIGACQAYEQFHQRQEIDRILQQTKTSKTQCSTMRQRWNGMWIHQEVLKRANNSARCTSNELHEVCTSNLLFRKIMVLLTFDSPSSSCEFKCEQDKAIRLR